MSKYFKVIANTLYISPLKSKELSDEIIKPLVTSDNSLTPLINYLDNKIRLKFTGTCLKQPNISYIYGKVVNIYIVYELCAQILISMGSPVMELDLIEDQVFHFQVW